MRASLHVFAVLLLVAPFAQPQSFTEGFDDGSSVGGWGWGTGNEFVSPLNGNPGSYVKDTTLFTAQPVLSTAPADTSVFTGDYAARGVTSVGVDLITLDKSFGVEGNRWLTLMLLDDNGTPFNPNDDRGAYFVGDTLVPDAGVPFLTPPGWASYDFAVDATSASLPAGWQAISFGGPLISWPDLMANVDKLQFWYGVPGTIFLFDSWDVGADNLRITTNEVCQTDLGFGGPGDLVASLCGNALSSGGTGELTVTGAGSGETVFVVVGLDATPTPFKGGNLVPVPVLFLFDAPADASGALLAPVPGGGGPATLVLQAAVVDASLPGGVALSNALEVTLLP